MKPLIVDLPYPKVCQNQDIHSANILCFAYASLKGELTATLQYTYHAFYFEQLDQEDYERLKEISLAEMMHLEILGKTILALGGNPKYLQYPNSQTCYNTQKVSQATTPQKMLMDDIMGEMDAITEYKKMLFALKNEEVCALIDRIILDEQLHLQTLKILLEKYSRPSCDAK